MMQFAQATRNPCPLSGWYAIKTFDVQCDYWHDIVFYNFAWDKNYATEDYFPALLKANLSDWI